MKQQKSITRLKSYFEKNYFDNKKKAAQLGNTQKGDGAAFHGRGLVQVTGRRNYTDWTQRLGKEGFQHDGQPVDLVHHPELFAVGVDVCGMADFHTFFRDAEPWIAQAAITKYGDPIADADLLRVLSPIHRIDRLRAPLLVV